MTPPATPPKPRAGQVMVDTTTGEPFVVLCSCAKSFPREHTARYVAQHPERFRAATLDEAARLHPPL